MKKRSRLHGMLFPGCLMFGLLATAPTALAQPPGWIAPVPRSSPEPPRSNAPCTGEQAPSRYQPFVSGAPEARDVGDPPVPAVAVRVRVPAEVAPGKEIEYRLTVVNVSRAAAYKVRLRDVLPANARFVRATPEPASKEPDLVWQLGTLEAGAKQEVTLVLAPTGEGDVRNCVSVQFEHGECVTTRVSRPDLLVEKRGPKQALLHDIMSYQIVITNNTGAPVTDVEVHDELDRGLQHRDGKQSRVFEVGTLAPGQTKRLDYQVVANEVGTQCNKVVVRAAGGLTKKAESCVVIAEPKLNVQVDGPRDGKANVQVPAAYPITVTNPGSAAATNVLIQARVPAGARLLGVSYGGRQVGDLVEWRLGTLYPGASHTVQYVLQAATTGEVRADVVARADRGLEVKGDARTTFAKSDAPAGVHLSVINRDANKVEVNGVTRYTITVVNQGQAPVSGVEIVATIPEQLKLQTTSPVVKPDLPRVKFGPETIEAGKSKSFEIEVKAEKAGEAHFEVELKADGLPRSVTHDETTTVYDATGGAAPRIQPQPAK